MGKLFKYITPLLGFLFPVVLFPVVIILLLVFLFRLPWYRRHGSRFFDDRDSFPNSHKRLSMNVEFTGPTWLIGWDLEFSGDGDHEHETKVSFWIIGRVWFTINNLFPKTWGPEYVTSEGEVVNWGTREYGFSIHSYSTWFRWWADTGGMGDQGYSWSVDIGRLIFGKIVHDEVVCGHSYHKVSLSEGNYPCMVIRKEVRRGRTRWFKKSYFYYLVVYGDPIEGGDVRWGYLLVKDEDGYYDYQLEERVKLVRFNEVINEGSRLGFVLDDGAKYYGPFSKVFRSEGIPIPGKGTAGYNCSDTFSLEWSGRAKNPADAAIKAQNSIQEHRRKYGGETWVPINVKYWEFKTK